MRTIIALGLMGVWCISVSAQTEIAYRFTASLEKQSVFLNIVIKAGSTCQGIFIERSTDSLPFVQIGSIPGICGSAASDVPYTFTDVSPVPNTVNYYRIRFGENGFSDIVSVLYVELKKSYKVSPNPATDVATIWFGNDEHDNFSLLVFDASGHRVWQRTSINENHTKVDVSGFLPGIYSFLLKAGTGKEINGKFVVQ